MESLYTVSVLRLISIFYYLLAKDVTINEILILVILVEISISILMIYTAKLGTKPYIGHENIEIGESQSFRFFLAMAVLMLTLVSFYLLKDATFGKLLSYQDIPGKGPLFLINTILLPAGLSGILQTQFKLFVNKIILVCLIFGSITFFSLIFITKSGLFAVCLIIVVMIIRRQIKIKFLLFFAPAILFVLINIYTMRGSDASVLVIIDLILLRIPTLEITTVIFEYPNSWFVFPTLGEKQFTQFITEDIFGRDANTMGMAPSLTGYFIMRFGLVGGFILIIVFLLFYLKLNLFVQSLRLSKKKILILSDYIFLNFLVFFIDGVPTFITLTEGGQFFMINLYLLFILMIANRIVR